MALPWNYRQTMPMWKENWKGNAKTWNTSMDGTNGWQHCPHCNWIGFLHNNQKMAVLSHISGRKINISLISLSDVSRLICLRNRNEFRVWTFSLGEVHKELLIIYKVIYFLFSVLEQRSNKSRDTQIVFPWSSFPGQFYLRSHFLENRLPWQKNW